VQRTHFSIGHVAPTLCCPRTLFEQTQQLSETELMIYSLLLLEIRRADPPGLEVTTQLIEQLLGLRLNESQLSVALNHLRSIGAGLVDFRKLPNGFQVRLLRPLHKLSPLAA
jgi:hypothetical protein